MSTEHARLVRKGDRFHLEDLAAKNGTYRQGARVVRSVLSDGDVIEIGHTFFVYRQSQPELPDLALHGGAGDPLLSLQPRLAELRDRLDDLAASRLPLLIAGETGTGKELVALSVHARSQRSGAFVPVNCGALPAALLESELFGHRKGAFSGAHQDHLGLVRSSDRGTLFLDEIGELALSAQAALLRVLQDSAVRPVGDTRAIPIDLRVVAATHRNLEAMVAEGTFRSDLLARLGGPHVELPPLRQRREDLGLIVAALLARHAPDRPAIALSQAMARMVFRRDWPRNVRELELWLAASLALQRDDGPLEPAPGSSAGQPEVGDAVGDAVGPAPPMPHIPEAELARRDRLVELLAQHGGNVAAVARALSKGREQVYRWIERYGLEPTSYRIKRS
jgi:DNA-binding NtrC family response regulator